ncbi:MAG: hypothetical protein D3916_11885 [Candidatus Electrothrix sp. MAN1_4]|nr:hypothetical protein [Candidatus Electrothrix sp. MAN1_4]
MFIEVCLISFGLFGGSELYKKIKQSSGEKRHTCGLRRKQEEPVGPATSNSTQEPTEFSSALESLTLEVSRLRQDFSTYMSASKENPDKAAEVSQPTVQQESISRPSIFEKLIEENVNLRQGDTGE